MRPRFLAVILAGLVVLAACGSDESSSGSFNDADVMFLQSMIPHHEQAVEMAEIALDPSSNAGPKVRDLATRVRSAQDGEITTMKGWLQGWGKPTTMDMSDGHDMSSMTGMMSAGDMQSLDAATGADFDRMWLRMMVAHHEGARDMARAVRTDGRNDDVEALAGRVITAQEAEIAEMKPLLAG